MNWYLTANSHSTSVKGKKEKHKIEERGKTRMQSVKGIRDYYPKETDVIRDSEEIAQLCWCGETMWLVRGNQNQLLRDRYFSSEKLSQETPQHTKQVKTIDSKSPVLCDVLATYWAVTVFLIYSPLSWTLPAPILTSHTVSGWSVI